MASDLRNIVAALKISSDLERIGDYAANVAKRAIVLTEMPPDAPAPTASRAWRRLVQRMIKDVLDAYRRGRRRQGRGGLAPRTRTIDELYNSLFRELLTYMMEDPRNITPCTHLLFIAKNIERIGDHATNIAEISLLPGQGHIARPQPPEGRHLELRRRRARRPAREPSKERRRAAEAAAS